MLFSLRIIFDFLLQVELRLGCLGGWPNLVFSYLKVTHGQKVTIEQKVTFGHKIKYSRRIAGL